MNMRAQSTLVSWGIGAPFLTPPGNRQLPSLRQWFYLGIGCILLIMALRPCARRARNQEWLDAGQCLAVDLEHEYQSAYWAGRRHSLGELFQ
jgi:hypothetical protein